MNTRSSAHVHTNFCDGRAPAEEMVRSALERGFVSRPPAVRRALLRSAGAGKRIQGRNSAAERKIRRANRPVSGHGARFVRLRRAGGL